MTTAHLIDQLPVSVDVRAMALDSDGSVFVGGIDYTHNDRNGFSTVAKFSMAEERVVFNNELSWASVTGVDALTVDEEGNVFAIANKAPTGPETPSGPYFVWLNPEGRQVWSTQLNLGDYYKKGIALGAMGEIYVSGGSSSALLTRIDLGAREQSPQISSLRIARQANEPGFRKLVIRGAGFQPGASVFLGSSIRSLAPIRFKNSNKLVVTHLLKRDLPPVSELVVTVVNPDGSQASFVAKGSQ